MSSAAKRRRARELLWRAVQERAAQAADLAAYACVIDDLRRRDLPPHEGEVAIAIVEICQRKIQEEIRQQAEIVSDLRERYEALLPTDDVAETMRG